MHKKGPDEGKRWHLNFRVTKTTRERIEAACAESGRSMAAELEYRIERSFWEDEFLERLREELGKEDANT